MIELKSTFDKSSLGSVIMVYGPTGCGKTGSATTCESPIWHINTEAKDARVVHAEIPHEKKIRYSKPESFEDLMETVNAEVDKAKEGRFLGKTVFFDGTTFGQVMVGQELEDARRTARIEDQNYRGIIDDTRYEKPDWGTLSSKMLRCIQLLASFGQYGVTVIMTGIEDQGSKKWGGGVKITPYFKGQEFPKQVHGLFDYIGYVVKPGGFKKDGTYQLPQVSFVALDDDMGDTFMARCSSAALAKACPVPMDWTQILGIIRGEKK